VALNATEATLLRFLDHKGPPVIGVYWQFYGEQTQAATLNARVYDQVAPLKVAEARKEIHLIGT
jgi:hypothetical protein